MKKLLLGTAAVGLALSAAPAYAQVELSVGGYFKGYGAYVDQDEIRDNVSTPAADESVSVNEFDFIRDTEVHLGGETTLDNGLTVGAHMEFNADGGEFTTQESYVYFSGGWGRVNFGAEDGAAYLLQVAAPSADSNIDGIRQYVNPFNNGAAFATVAGGGNATLIQALGGATGGNFTLDYDQNITTYDDKLTYLSPILNGFQAGVSYTPDTTGYADDTDGVDVLAANPSSTFGDAYEAALRYEGQFNNIGVNLGAGYTFVTLNETVAIGANNVGATTAAALFNPSDDRQAWNVGADIDVGPFGFGVIYKEDDNGERIQVVPDANSAAIIGDEEQIWVFGADYTTGPFKIGASYLNSENTFAVENFDSEKYAVGVTYTYGPGMSFRGSIGHQRYHLGSIGGQTDDGPGRSHVDTVSATYGTIGTQINF